MCRVCICIPTDIVGKACERGSSQSDHVPHLPSSRRLTTSHFNQTMASPGAGISLPPQDKWPSPDAGAAPLSDPDIREPSNGAHLNDDGRSAPPLDSAGDYHSDVPPPDSHKPFRENKSRCLALLVPLPSSQLVTLSSANVSPGLLLQPPSSLLITRRLPGLD